MHCRKVLIICSCCLHTSTVKVCQGRERIVTFLCACQVARLEGVLAASGLRSPQQPDQAPSTRLRRVSSLPSRRPVMQLWDPQGMPQQGNGEPELAADSSSPVRRVLQLSPDREQDASSGRHRHYLSKAASLAASVSDTQHPLISAQQQTAALVARTLVPAPCNKQATQGLVGRQDRAARRAMQACAATRQIRRSSRSARRPSTSPPW